MAVFMDSLFGTQANNGLVELLYWNGTRVNGVSEDGRKRLKINQKTSDLKVRTWTEMKIIIIIILRIRIRAKFNCEELNWEEIEAKLDFLLLLGFGLPISSPTPATGPCSAIAIDAKRFSADSFAIAVGRFLELLFLFFATALAPSSQAVGCFFFSLLHSHLLFFRFRSVYFKLKSVEWKMLRRISAQSGSFADL